MKKHPEQIEMAVQAEVQRLTPPTTTAASESPRLRDGLRDAPAKAEAMFEPFKTLGDPALIAARSAAINFCISMGSARTPGYWLTLCGKSGIGKTMLAKLCARFFHRHLEMFVDERADPARERRLRKGGFKAWGDAITEMIGGDFTGLRNLRSDWFVVLDDIGTEHVRHRELATAKLYEVLNAREGLFTIITTNLSVQQVGEQMDTRIASRIIRHGAVVVDINAKDFNLRRP